MNDWDYVNFSQDYELNHHLQKVDKRQTEANRSTLKVMGNELKNELNERFLTHKQFHSYISQSRNLQRLE